MVQWINLSEQWMCSSVLISYVVRKTAYPLTTSGKCIGIFTLFHISVILL